MTPSLAEILLPQRTDSLRTEESPGKNSHAEALYAFPATHGQVRFWSLDQLDPGNPALNMPLMWRCTGPLDVHALQQAFMLCADRHETLRTTFEWRNGRLVQMLHPETAVNLPLVDLEPFKVELQRAEADRMTREHAAFRFDLQHGPLLALKLLRFDANHHLLLVTLHHIVCDGISNGILLRDMRVFYESLRTGRPADLPELPVQFPDYAVWQENWLNGAGPAASLAFWRESLGTNFSRLSLTRDPDARTYLRAQEQESTGAIETLLIPPDLQMRAQEFCKREHVTLNILLFGVFAALMHRLTGQRDLTIGSPCANRTDETEELIGLFMNIQVMRLCLSEEETFRTLLGKVEKWTLGAYEHQTLPFEMLVHDAHFANTGRAFEIPVFFLYQKSFMVTHRIGELEIVPLRSESPGAVFEMMFAIVDRAEEGPRLQLEYNPRYYKLLTIQSYLRMFNELLFSALSRPEDRIQELAAAETIEDVHEPKEGELKEQSGAHAEDEYVPPRDVIERQLANLWQTTLGIPEISIRAHFFSLGAGSLAALRLITKINRVFAMDLGLASLVSAGTIEGLAQVIQARFAPNTDSSLVPLQPHGRRSPLFITHGVGGNVISFHGLAARLGEDQPVYGIQAQSLVGREPALLRLEDLAAYYVRDIRGVQPRGPYHLLGYSFGGTLALEMARQLQSQGEEVALLAMLDARTRAYDETMARSAPAPARLNQRLDRLRGNTGRLTARDRLHYLLGKLHTRTIRWGCKAAARLDLRQVPAWMRSAYDINFVAIENYRPEPYDGRLVLFRASDQEHTGGVYDLGWSQLFEQGIEIHDLPGDHERLFLEPNIDQLAEQIRDLLRRSMAVRL